MALNNFLITAGPKVVAGGGLGFGPRRGAPEECVRSHSGAGTFLGAIEACGAALRQNAALERCRKTPPYAGLRGRAYEFAHAAPLRGTLTRHPYAAPLRGQAGFLGPLARVPLRAPLTRAPYARPLRGMIEPLAGVFQRGSVGTNPVVNNPALACRYSLSHANFSFLHGFLCGFSIFAMQTFKFLHANPG